MADIDKNVLGESEEYEPEIVDLDGEPFEIIDSIDYEGASYVALVPYVEDLDSEGDEIEFIILKEIEKDGEFFLGTIEDDTLYAKIGDLFIEHFESFQKEE
ncbi:MAG: DUF1292 domain-containing protein [Oscillospiraceae bacterium]|nr:DUF1292 domain-containing protein [Oscillospiraceae bacterium]